MIKYDFNFLATLSNSGKIYNQFVIMSYNFIINVGEQKYSF